MESITTPEGEREYVEILGRSGSGGEAAAGGRARRKEEEEGKERKWKR